MPVIPALGKLRHKDLKFKASLGHRARLCLKKQPHIHKRVLEEKNHFPLPKPMFQRCSSNCLGPSFESVLFKKETK
jgi:hypothetical protein